MDEFEAGHSDRVTVLHINFDGTRILTASIDHKIKVWDRNRKTGERTLVDTWTAHDADIRDAKFLHPTLGSYIGSIAADLKCHLWTEDPSQAPNSGRRFRRIATIPSGPRIPFSSMDFKTVEHIYTYLALIDRQGLLSIYEPASPDDLKDWTLLDQFHVSLPQSQPPGRGEETSFKVRFDQNPTPLAYINSLSDDESQLGLVVSCLNEVKIYHSSSSNNPGTDASGTGSTHGSHRLTFHETFRFPTHPSLVRDVAWSPFNVRGIDRIATACKDGSVRIFELGVASNPLMSTSSPTTNTNSSIATAATAVGTGGGPRGGSQAFPSRTQFQAQHQSSLTSGLTGNRSITTQPSAGPSTAAGSSGSNNNNNGSISSSNNNSNSDHNPTTMTPAFQSTSTTTPAPGSSTPSRAAQLFPFKYHLASPPVVLSNVHGDAWSVTWDGQGQVLMSSGSDGVVKIWRKAVSGERSGGGVEDENGRAGGGGGGGVSVATGNRESGVMNVPNSGGWKLFAEQGVEFEDEEGQNEEEEEDQKD